MYTNGNTEVKPGAQVGDKSLSRASTTRRLARNTFSLSLNQVSRVGFNTVLSLLVARQLGAEGFGKYSVILAYVNIFQVLAAGGAPRLVIREMARQPEDHPAWFQLALVNQVLAAVASMALMALVGSVLNHPADTTQALFIAALSMLPFAISSAAESAFQAQERMNFVTLPQILGGGVQVIGSIVVLLAGYGVSALAWMIVAWQVIVAAIEVGLALRLGLGCGFRVNLKAAVLLFKQSFEFFLMSLSVVIFSRLDVLILSQMADEKAVGLYNAAYLIVRVITFVSVSFSNAAYPLMSRLFTQARQRFQVLLHKSLVLGNVGTLITAILLVVCADPLIGLLYRGEAYRLSAFLLRIEAPFVIIFTWNALLSGGLMAGDLQNRSVIVSGVKLGAGLVYYLLLTAWLGATGTAIATVLAGLTGTLLNIYFFNREVFTLDLAELAGKPLAIALILSGVLWLGLVCGLGWLWLATGAMVLYAVLLVLFRVFSAEDVRLLGQTLRPLRRGEV